MALTVTPTSRPTPPRSAPGSASEAPEPDRGDRAHRPLPPWAWTPILVVVAVKSALSLAFAGRYGWHYDELYYRAAGQHLMWGYTDFPPLVPVIARLAQALFGASLVGLRSFAILAGAGVLVACAGIARELGGQRWAQSVAALAAVPPMLISNAMFQTVSFDQLAWACVLLAALRVLRLGTVRSWLVLGLAIGIAGETKYTVLVLVGLLGLGLLVTRAGRARLRGPGPWLAGLLAVSIMAPNLWWEAAHGWPSVTFFAGRNADTRADFPPPAFIAQLLLMAGPAALGLWVGGFRSLLSDRRWRAVGIGAAGVPIAFLVLGGKGYYAMPALLAGYGAGAAAWETRVSARWRRALPACLIVVPLVSSPLLLPVLPRATAVRLGLMKSRVDYEAELGWPQYVDAMGSAWRGLPSAERAHTVFLAQDYAEAGALQLWGPDRGLPPVVSGALSYRYWPPAATTMRATTVVAVGYPHDWLAGHCTTVDRVGRVPTVTDTQDGEGGQPIWACRLPGTVADLWPHLGHD